MQRSRQLCLQGLRTWLQGTAATSEATHQACSLRPLSSQPAIKRTGGDVPEGHRNSDLSPIVCHIGLGRRRDLTLRQDLCLYQGGEKKTLAEVFKGKKAILVGFPGGPVCTEKHLPGYVAIADTMAQKGVDKVVFVTVDTPQNVEAMSQRQALTNTRVEIIADKTGGLMRLLGLEYGAADATSGPRCQRFAGIVEDGILLKLKVEDRPAELRCTDAHSMMNLWDCVYSTEVSDARIKAATAATA